MTPEQEQALGQEVRRRLETYDELCEMLCAPPVEAVARLTKERDELREALAEMLESERRAYGAEGRVHFERKYARFLALALANLNKTDGDQK